MNGRLKHAQYEFEYDAKFQTKFHLRMAYFWIGNAVAVGLVSVLLPHIWEVVSIRYLTVVSLYANFATDWGAASASEASEAASAAASHDTPVE